MDSERHKKGYEDGEGLDERSKEKHAMKDEKTKHTKFP